MKIFSCCREAYQAPTVTSVAGFVNRVTDCESEGGDQRPFFGVNR